MLAARSGTSVANEREGFTCLESSSATSIQDGRNISSCHLVILALKEPVHEIPCVQSCPSARDPSYFWRDFISVALEWVTWCFPRESMERDQHGFLGKRWELSSWKHNCLREFPKTRRKIRSWKRKWPYQNYRTSLTFILICMCKCFWLLSCVTPNASWSRNEKTKIKAPLLSVTELCFIPQCYDFKCCCHLWLFVLFGRKYLYLVWLASVEYLGCFSFQFKKLFLF